MVSSLTWGQASLLIGLADLGQASLLRTNLFYKVGWDSVPTHPERAAHFTSPSFRNLRGLINGLVLASLLIGFADLGQASLLIGLADLGQASLLIGLADLGQASLLIRLADLGTGQPTIRRSTTLVPVCTSHFH